MDIRAELIQILCTLPAVVIAMSVHEFSHARVSDRMGDPLPSQTGRLSLNPLKHIDIIGFITLLLFRFGWAKPVNVDPRFYKKRKLGLCLVAFAGPCANLLTAFGAMTAAILFSYVTGQMQYAGTTFASFCVAVEMLLTYLLYVNLGLAIFNLIPVPPLDGSRLLAALLPSKYYYKFLEKQNIIFVVLILLVLNVPGRLLGIFGVPSWITQYFDLSHYISLAVRWVMNVMQSLLVPPLQLLIDLL